MTQALARKICTTKYALSSPERRYWLDGVWVSLCCLAGAANEIASG